MVLHHVAQGPGLFVVGAARLHADGLGHRDLHVGYVIAVPERLVDLVGEAQDEEVLDRFLPEIVVDAVDLLLAEVPSQLPVEGAGAVDVVAERLLHDDARPAVAVLGEAGVAQVLDDVVVEAGRRGAVEEPVGGSAATVLDVGQRRLQPRVEREVLGITGRVVERPGKALPHVLGRRLDASVIADGLAHPSPEFVVAHLRAGDGHDGERFRQRPGRVECEERGQELPASQIAGGAEDDQRKRIISGRHGSTMRGRAGINSCPPRARGPWPGAARGARRRRSGRPRTPG